jgi:hypothetical protein
MAAATVALLWLLTAGPGVAKEARDWQGRPDFEQGESLGYFVWRDDDGWHVRWTTKGKRRTFAGTISCDGAFMNVEPVSKGQRDWVKRRGDGVIRFDTVVEGGVDGVDFRLSPSAERITFDLEMDGRPVAPDLVRLGARKRRPASVPFTIDRER